MSGVLRHDGCVQISMLIRSLIRCRGKAGRREGLLFSQGAFRRWQLVLSHPQGVEKGVFKIG